MISNVFKYLAYAVMGAASAIGLAFLFLAIAIQEFIGSREDKRIKLRRKVALDILRKGGVIAADDLIQQIDSRLGDRTGRNRKLTLTAINRAAKEKLIATYIHRNEAGNDEVFYQYYGKTKASS